MNQFYKAFVFSVFLPLGLSAQNYGQMMFPHSAGGSKLCDALTIEHHTTTPGYVMVGYKDTSSASTYNFIIDRTALGGAVNAPNNSFQKAYRIHANPNEECDYLIRPVNNCSGLSIIETNGANAPGQPLARFAVAGAYSEACFFALFDISGNCVFSTSYKFPARSVSNVTQPKIIECTNTPGEYILCGSFNRTMYALRVDANGNVMWSHFYPIQGEPRDMIPAAYGPNKDNEFLVVGKTYVNEVNTGSDGIIMMLDQQNGSVIKTLRISIWPYNYSPPSILGNQHFNAIEVVRKFGAQQCGYMIGGYTDSFSSVYHGSGLIYRVDSLLNIQNIEIHTSPLDTLGAEVVDIMARKAIVPNGPGTHFRYYLLMKSDSGITVINRGNALNVANLGFNYNYKIPGRVLHGCKLGMINDMNSPYGGLQIYNTYYGSSGNTQASHHLITAYFNGITACNSFTNQTLYTNPASSAIYDTIVPYGSLSRCPSFMITNKEDPGSVVMCGPLDSIAGGYNGRMFQAQKPLQPEGTISTQLYPNPAKTNCTIAYAIHQNSRVKLELYNMLGQWVYTIENTQKEAGTYQTEIKLSELGLEKGMYFVNYGLGEETGSCKLLFEGE